MNKLKGKIAEIESTENMSLVNIEIQGDVLCCVVLETPDTAGYLKIGTSVTILFKETEVAIAKNLTGLISLRNRIKSRVKQVDRDKLFSRIVLDYKGHDVVSIITAGSAQRLEIKAGDEVEWLVKTNEISLMQGVSDEP